MQWWEIKLTTPHLAGDALAAVLQAWPDVQGVMIENDAPTEAPHPEYGEFLDDNLLTLADEVIITFYLPYDAGAEDSLRQRVHTAIGQVVEGGLLQAHSDVQMSVDVLDESVWAGAFQQEFEPIEVGQRFIIVPRWQRVEWSSKAGRLPIYLEPGRAFGTGMHATTQLCLQALEKHVGPGTRVLDIGSGTGILSIAAAKLGAASVLAVDLDPVAVEAALENIRDNEASGAVDVRLGDLMTGIEGQTFDVVIANILRDPVMALAPDAWGCLVPGGVFLSSGYLAQDEARVHERLTSVGFMVTAVLRQADWSATVAVKQR